MFSRFDVTSGRLVVRAFSALRGTSEEAAKAISRSNFLPSSGGCFGAGIYFADDAKKSNQYAKGRTDPLT